MTDAKVDRTRTLERGGPDAPRLRPSRHLFVVLQAAHPHEGASRHALDDLDEVIIGRGNAYGWQRTVERGVRRLRIDVPDDTMSTVHVRLTVRVVTVLAADAGSKNGTLVNGQRTEGVELAPGDVVETGSTLFHYAVLPTPPDAALDLRSAELVAPPGLRTLLPELAMAFVDLGRVAASPAPILLLGETGTGKELIARAVHELSRRPGPFVAINCGAISPALLASELFGHKKGAFSGAIADRVGVLEAASGGTLFLDEIGEIPEHAQVALLRALQEREVTPVGASHPTPIDLRVVAATHRDLGMLREDFVARVRGFTLELLPLARRVPDLGLVIITLLERLAPGRAVRFDVDAARAIVRHRWPRNIRELERTLETALALAGQHAITTHHLQLDASPVAAASDDPRRAELVALLEQHGGNISAIATATGKKRQQIQKWLRKYGIDPDRFR